MESNSRRHMLALLLLAAALVPSAWTAWQWRTVPALGAFHDDALYVASAQSLAAGHGYRIASLPGEPYQTKYPPFYPALLSLIFRVQAAFPAASGLTGVAALSWVSLAVSTWLVRRLFVQSGTGPQTSTALAAVFAVTPAAIWLGVMAMAELPCCALIFASLLLAERRQPVAAGIAAGLAFLTRTSALPLLITVPAVFAWRRQWGSGWRFAVAMLPFVAGWQAWAAAHRAPADPLTLYYTDYLAYYRIDVALAEWPAMFADNLNRAGLAMGGYLVFGLDDGFASLTVSRVLLAGVIAGCVRLVRSGALLQYAAFGLVYLLQMLAWNYPPNERFLIPLAPLVFAGFWRELQATAAMVRAAYAKRGADRVVAVALAGLLVWLGFAAVRGLDTGLREAIPQLLAERRDAYSAHRGAQEWIARNTSPGDVLLSFHDGLEYLHTGRPGYSLRVPPSLLKRSQPDELRRFFAPLPALAARHGVTYAVLSPSDYNDGPQQVAAKAYWAVFEDPSRFERVFTDRGSRVYRLMKSAVAVR